MAGSVNKVILVGNLGRDPESRSSRMAARWSSCASPRRKAGRIAQRRAQGKDRVAHGQGLQRRPGQRRREISAQGQQGLYRRRADQTRKWQDQSGNDRYSTEIVLQGFNSVLTMLDGAPGQGGGAGRGGGGGEDWRRRRRIRGPVLEPRWRQLQRRRPARRCAARRRRLSAAASRTISTTTCRSEQLLRRRIVEGRGALMRYAVLAAGFLLAACGGGSQDDRAIRTGQNVAAAAAEGKPAALTAATDCGQARPISCRSMPMRRSPPACPAPTGQKRHVSGTIVYLDQESRPRCSAGRAAGQCLGARPAAVDRHDVFGGRGAPAQPDGGGRYDSSRCQLGQGHLSRQARHRQLGRSDLASSPRRSPRSPPRRTCPPGNRRRPGGSPRSLFITNGPCATIGSSIGSAWPNRNSAGSCAAIVTASPSLSSARLNCGMRVPATSIAPRAA
jgi:single-strand DNA-binding protein